MILTNSYYYKFTHSHIAKLFSMMHTKFQLNPFKWRWDIAVILFTTGTGTVYCYYYTKISIPPFCGCTGDSIPPFCGCSVFSDHKKNKNHKNFSPKWWALTNTPRKDGEKNQLTFRVSEKIVKMSAVLTIHGHHALHSMMPKLCGRQLQRGSL